MADMFGAPIGINAHDANLRGNITTALGAQQALGQIAMQPGQLRMQQIQLEKAETELAQDRQFAELLRQGQTPGAAAGEGETTAKTPTVAERLYSLAGQAANAGLVGKAGELAKTAAGIMQKEEAAAASRASQELTRVKTAQERMELLGQIYSGVTDQAGLERANMIYMAQTGQPAPLAGSPFNPELIKTLRAQAVSVAKQMELEGQRITRENTEAYRQATLAQRNAQIQIARERAAEQRRHNEAQEKNGGAGGAALASPTQAELDEVSRRLKDMGLDSKKVDRNSWGSMTFSIGSRARELQQSNRALGRAQAIAQAVQEAKDNGELEIEEVGGREIAGVRFGATNKFAGRKPSQPITQLPPAARAQLKEGEVTTFNNGQVWTLENGKAKRVK